MSSVVAEPTPLQAVFSMGTLLVGGVAALDKIELLLRSFKFRFCSESDLQNGIEAALNRREVAFERERTLSVSDRPDFLIPCLEGSIAIEVKTKGTFPEALRQVARYAGHERVVGVVLIGSPIWVSRMPAEITGTPIRSVRLMTSFA